MDDLDEALNRTNHAQADERAQSGGPDGDTYGARP